MRARPLSRSALAVLGLLLVAACGTPSSKTAGSGAAGAASAAAEASGAVALVKRYPAVGDKRTVIFVEDEHTKLALAGPKGSGEEDVKLTFQTERTEECLAVADRSCSKMTVTFSKSVGRGITNGGPPKESGLPIHGKTYLLSFAGGAVTVTDGQGAAVADNEVRLVKRACATFGREGELLDALPAQVKVGDSIGGAAAALLLAGRDLDFTLGPDMVKTTLEVSAIKDAGGKKLVVLDAVRTYKGLLQPGQTLDAKVEGALELRADIGRSTRSALAGSWMIQYDGTGEPPGVTGKTESKMTLTADESYSF